MGLFRKKDRVLDLTKKYKQDQERAQRTSASSENSEASPLGGGFGIFGNADAGTTTSSSSDSSSGGYVDFSSGSEGDDKKKKLAKRLMDMTDKLEDVSNQIYHLQQRLEVLERKLNVGGY